MSSLLSIFLTLILNYGYPIIVLVILGSYIGLPVPSEGILLAAGSLTVDNNLSMWVLIPLASATAITGDVVGYYIGKKFGKTVLEKFAHRVGLTEHRIVSVGAFLAKWGIWCIFLTRWLITPLGTPVNILAGFTNYPFKRFLTFVILGETLFASIYVYLGYLFGANWQTLLEYVSDAPYILALIVVGLGSAIYALRLYHKRG